MISLDNDVYVRPDLFSAYRGTYKWPMPLLILMLTLVHHVLISLWSGRIVLFTVLAHRNKSNDVTFSLLFFVVVKQTYVSLHIRLQQVTEFQRCLQLQHGYSVNFMLKHKEHRLASMCDLTSKLR